MKHSLAYKLQSRCKRHHSQEKKTRLFFKIRNNIMRSLRTSRRSQKLEIYVSKYSPRGDNNCKVYIAVIASVLCLIHLSKADSLRSQANIASRRQELRASSKCLPIITSLNLTTYTNAILCM